MSQILGEGGTKQLMSWHRLWQLRLQHPLLNGVFLSWLVTWGSLVPISLHVSCRPAGILSWLGLVQAWYYLFCFIWLLRGNIKAVKGGVQICQCHFCYILLVKAVIWLIQTQGVEEIDYAFRWGCGKITLHNMCGMGNTVVSNLENITCHKPEREQLNVWKQKFLLSFIEYIFFKCLLYCMHYASD